MSYLCHGGRGLTKTPYKLTMLTQTEGFASARWPRASLVHPILVFLVVVEKLLSSLHAMNLWARESYFGYDIISGYFS